MTFGGAIQRCRVQNNITTAHVAALLGVTERTVENWEASATLPDFMTGLRLTNAVGLPYRDLIAIDGATDFTSNVLGVAHGEP